MRKVELSRLEGSSVGGDRQRSLVPADRIAVPTAGARGEHIVDGHMLPIGPDQRI